MDLKATACSRLRVNRENFQTRISLKGASGLLASSTYSRATRVVVLLGVVPERPKLGGDGQVHVPGGRWTPWRREPLA